VIAVKASLITALTVAAIAGCSNGDALMMGTATSGDGAASGAGSATTAKGGSGATSTAGSTGSSGSGSAAGSNGSAASSGSGSAAGSGSGSAAGAKGVADASVTFVGSGDAAASGCGLPADVSSMLAAACTSCHSAPPVNGALMPLVTYANLIAPAVSNPSETVGALCVTRMQSSVSPMPPVGNPAPSASAAAAFASWVSAGMPQASCNTTGASGSSGSTGSSGAAGTSGSSSGSAGSQSGTSSGASGTAGADASTTYTPVCTSNMMAPATFGPTMEPGNACVACHNTFLAGTVYPTAHEPNDCDGVNVSNATVRVTDATGAVTSISINNVGNFYTNGSALTPPVQVEVVYNGATRAMATPLSIGDCNSCHTEQGDNGAPGRIMLP
jgi:hypothetical protein